MKDHNENSTVRTRELGHALRDAMERAKLSAKWLAPKLGSSESSLSRVVRGRAVPTEVELSVLLALCDVVGEEREKILTLYKNYSRVSLHAGNRHWRVLADQLSSARRVTEYSPATIPNLLHTPAYMRALVVRSASLPFEAVDDRVDSRLSTHTSVSNSRCLSVFYIPESALLLPVGDQRVMSAQLHHLLAMAKSPLTSIRIIPTAVGAHAGLFGSCCFIESDEFDPIVAVEMVNAGLFIEDAASVRSYQTMLTALDTTALPREQSTELIRRITLARYDSDPQGK